MGLADVWCRVSWQANGGVCAISQSGETKDVHRAVVVADKQGK